MGYNSGLVIMNDSLHEIAENPLQFTEGVVRTIHTSRGPLSLGRSVDIAVRGHVNAATLFHMAHADEHKVFVVGGNGAMAIPGGLAHIRNHQDPNETNLALIRQMADKAGYRLVKK